MDYAQVADAIAAGTRVRGGGVEGRLVSAHLGYDNVGVLEHSAGTTMVQLDAIELLEEIDAEKVTAYHEGIAAAVATLPPAQPYSRQPGED